MGLLAIGPLNRYWGEPVRRAGESRTKESRRFRRRANRPSWILPASQDYSRRPSQQITPRARSNANIKGSCWAGPLPGCSGVMPADGIGRPSPRHRPVAAGHRHPFIEDSCLVTCGLIARRKAWPTSRPLPSAGFGYLGSGRSRQLRLYNWRANCHHCDSASVFASVIFWNSVRISALFCDR